MYIEITDVQHDDHKIGERELGQVRYGVHRIGERELGYVITTAYHLVLSYFIDSEQDVKPCYFRYFSQTL